LEKKIHTDTFVRNSSVYVTWNEDRRADLRNMNDFYFMTLLLFCFTCQFCHTQYLSHAEKNKWNNFGWQVWYFDLMRLAWLLAASMKYAFGTEHHHVSIILENFSICWVLGNEVKIVFYFFIFWKFYLKIIFYILGLFWCSNVKNNFLK
jgi:hypothetical protein